MRPLLALLCTLFIAATVLAVASAHEEHFHTQQSSNFNVGIGTYDITGPVQGVEMMGYAMLEQIAEGLNLRLRARAYIFEANGQRVVVVNLDSCMTMQSVKLMVIERLRAKYGSLYQHDNVMITGTHTHSGPGAYSYYALYDISSLGFSKENFEAVVGGILSSIDAAHNNMKPSRVYVNQGKLYNSNANRSPTSYVLNSAAERALYPDGDTDKDMTVIKIVGLDGSDRGMITWFAVHGTAIGNKNRYVSGDNKGIASQIVEEIKNPGALPGAGAFVAAFVQANAGDVTPNTLGAFCPDNTPCDRITSTCGGKTELCVARGPGYPNQYKSAEIIGRNQAEMALQLYASATEELLASDGVDFRHSWLDMPQLNVTAKWTGTGKDEHLCVAALGDSFAAGTTDGPGVNWFHQHETMNSPFWEFIVKYIEKPTPAQVACQLPKPIILNVGQLYPMPWAPWILPLQVIRIGRVVNAALPGEPTTMSGRRLRNTIVQAFKDTNSRFNVLPLVTGLANTYAQYITTLEEYGGQRYEAASTLFGPHELAGFQQETYRLATDMSVGRPSLPGPFPPDLRNTTISFIPPVLFDEPPLGGHFGDVHQQPASSYARGSRATVIFWGANPRNNLMTQSTYLTVEQQTGTGWQVVRTDSHTSTWFHWQQKYVAASHVTIDWDIEPETPVGTYRIRYFGHSKELDGKISAFTGTSNSFTVTA